MQEVVVVKTDIYVTWENNLINQKNHLHEKMCSHSDFSSVARAHTHSPQRARWTSVPLGGPQGQKQFTCNITAPLSLQRLKPAPTDMIHKSSLFLFFLSVAVASCKCTLDALWEELTEVCVSIGNLQNDF